MLTRDLLAIAKFLFNITSFVKYVTVFSAPMPYLIGVHSSLMDVSLLMHIYTAKSMLTCHF